MDNVYEGDCIEVMAKFDAESFDAIVTDPPYGLGFMGKEWDRPGSAARGYKDDEHLASTPYGRAQAEYGGASYGTADDFNPRFQAWCLDWATEAFRILKPGAYLLAFGGTRTYHRLACAIEDAGFEIRDSLHWIYGSGFPKSLDVSKAIDKAAGVERTETGRILSTTGNRATPSSAMVQSGLGAVGVGPQEHRETEPATDDAKTWAGWGTALKPAHEPIVLARKPLTGTVAANVLEHGTGALNVDGCRVGMSDADRATYPTHTTRIGGSNNNRQNATGADGKPIYDVPVETPAGRWPPNVLLTHNADCVPVGERKVKTGTAVRRNLPPEGGVPNTIYGPYSKPPGPDVTYADADGTETVTAYRCTKGCPVAEMDRQSGASQSRIGQPRGADSGDGWGMTATGAEYDDQGGASRFFPIFRYEAKASSDERPRDGGVAHPTVKPVDLMRWLVRLVTPPGGKVLDPFAGTGTTGEACIIEGFDWVLIEREPQYIALIEQRLSKDIQPVMF